MSGKHGSSPELNYALVGSGMADIERNIVDTFIGAVERGEKQPRSIMLWGEPGCGKTYTVLASGKTLEDHFKREVIMNVQLTSCLEPPDIAGIPSPVVINGVTQFTRYLPPEWAWLASVEYEKHMQESDPSYTAPPMILFFDDIVAAHFQTQTAFFKGVHEGKWGHLQQRNNVMVIAAGNRMEDNAGANDMPTALANRFQHVYANPTTDDWLTWATGRGNIHPFIIGYMRHNKQDLNEFCKEVANREEKAFASPRTWEMVSDLLHEGRISISDDARFTRAIFGLIGQPASTNFLAYMKNTSAVVPPSEIVKNPKKARIPSRKNLDALHATVASLEKHIKDKPTDWKAGVVYSMREEMVPDVAILLAKTVCEVLQKLTPTQRSKAMGDTVFEDFALKFEDMFAEILVDD